MQSCRVAAFLLGLHSVSKPTTVGAPAYNERIWLNHSSISLPLLVTIVSMVFPAKLTLCFEMVVFVSNADIAVLQYIVVVLQNSNCQRGF
jgi:hypothetical protein